MKLFGVIFLTLLIGAVCAEEASTPAAIAVSEGSTKSGNQGPKIYGYDFDVTSDWWKNFVNKFFGPDNYESDSFTGTTAENSNTPIAAANAKARNRQHHHDDKSKKSHENKHRSNHHAHAKENSYAEAKNGFA